MSYLLDTNVISELNKPKPNENVIYWLNTHQSIFISSITKAEMLYGIHTLDDGKRKSQLLQMVNAILALFDNRILPFCTKSADYYAKIILQRKNQGRPILMADALIASIALANNLTVVTRNVKDFENINGLPIVNPF